MGNCKSTSDSNMDSSTSAIKAQKPIEKSHKKSLRSFIRRILLTKRRCDGKISPDTSNTGTCTLGDCAPSVQQEPAKSLRKEFCKRDDLFPCENAKPSSSSEIVQVAKDQTVVVSEKVAKLRKERYRVHALRGLKEVSELKEKLRALQERQEKRKMLLDLMSLRATILHSSGNAQREAQLKVSIEKLTKCYSRYERKLYQMKAERAISEAKVDLFLTKLSPKLKYADIYVNKKSYYLSPIPEESDAELHQLDGLQ